MSWSRKHPFRYLLQHLTAFQQVQKIRLRKSHRWHVQLMNRLQHHCFVCVSRVENIQVSVTMLPAEVARQMYKERNFVIGISRWGKAYAAVLAICPNRPGPWEAGC